ncbi:MAG: DUF503 domain-containing protein [Bacillota bacterium]|nr:DUF503 domain-containing protein [Bacillota bacterium]
MIIGTLSITLFLPECHSLKEKRSILKSLVVKTRNKFNAAIAEVDHQDKWQKATVGIAVVSTSTSHVYNQLQSIVDFIELEPRIVLGEIVTEIL